MMRPDAAPPRIFDAPARRRARARAARIFAREAYLCARAAEDILDRLAAVNRRFETVAIIGDGGLIPDQALFARGTTRVLRGDVSRELLSASGTKPAAVFAEDALPLADGAYDAILSVLTLHAVDDLPGALAQIRRALKPDGLFIGALFSGETLGRERKALLAAEAETTGGASPRIFPFADVRDLGGLLQRAGFALPVADTDRVEVEYSSAARLIEDLRACGETNVLAKRDTRPPSRALAGALIGALQQCVDTGPVLFEIATITGWAPHESQQKPLAPGSARASLSEAVLKGTEG